MCRVNRFALFVLAGCAVMAVPRVASSASPEIFLTDQPEVYLAIDKLEGFGLLPGLMTDDRGLDAREVAREAEKVEDTDDPFAEGMLQFLRLEGVPRMDFLLRAGPEYSRHGEVPPNAQGLPLPNGTGFRVGGFFRASVAEWMSLQARGDYVAGGDDGSVGRLEETSLRLGWPQATLEAGRFSLWWGPGRHGSLLFTTNAEPLIGVRIRNPRPIPLGWWFRFLGLFQYDLFVSRLEKNRPVPDSLLSGFRVAIKPKPWLELGVSRVLHFGGEGRDESLSTFFDIFRGQSESPGSTPEGNSLASLDAKFRLPFRRQPITVYMEAGGEDQSGSGIPSRWAWVGGIFLPSIGTFQKADLRIEFGSTVTNAPGVWYLHPQYPHQYRGRILGHHMGTDARDLFVEAHYFLLPTSYLELNADITRRTFPGPAREETERFGAGMIFWLTKNWRNETRLAVSRISNENGIPGADGTNLSFQLLMAYQYRGF
jgi:hypothetical protein